MTKNFFAATPLFATGIGLGWIGATLILAGLQAVECGCFVMRRD